MNRTYCNGGPKWKRIGSVSVCMIVLLAVVSFSQVSKWRNAIVQARFDSKRFKIESEAAQAEAMFFRAQHLWAENRANDAQRLLAAIPRKHRNIEWYVSHQKFLGAGLTLYGHQEGILDVAFSPDGSKIASCGKDETIRIWDTTYGNELACLPDVASQTRSIDFSPDGFSIASAGMDVSTIAIWSVKNCEKLTTIDIQGPEDGFVTKVVFSADGKRIFGQADCPAIWDAETGAKLASFDNTNNVSGFALSPDNKRMAISVVGELLLVDTENGNELLSIPQESQSRSIAFGPEGQLIASTSDGRTIKLYDLKTGVVRNTLLGHLDQVCDIEFSPDGTMLASCDVNGLVKIWNARSGMERAQLVGHTAPVVCLAFSPDGSRIVSGSLDKTLKVWSVAGGSHYGHSCFNPADLTQYATCHTIVDGQAGVLEEYIEISDGKQLRRRIDEAGYPFAFSPDGSRMAFVRTESNDIKIFDFSSEKLHSPLRGHSSKTRNGFTSRILGIVFSSDGSRLASESTDRTVKIWDVETGTQLKSFRSYYTGHFNELSFSPNGNLLACGFHDEVFIRDLSNEGEIVQTIAIPGIPGALTFSSDSTSLAIGCADGSVLLHHVGSGASKQVFLGHSSGVSGVGFASNDSRLVSVDLQRNIKIWKLDTGVELLSIAGDTLSISGVSSRQGSVLLPEQVNEPVALNLSICDSIEVSRCSGHVHKVKSVTFSPDGKEIHSRDVNGRRIVWDRESGQQLAKFQWDEFDTARNQFPDRRWMVYAAGIEVFLVDRHFWNTPMQKQVRKQMARTCIAWHEQQAEVALQESNWFAEVFHRAIVLESGYYNSFDWRLVAERDFNDAIQEAKGEWKSRDQDLESHLPNVVKKVLNKKK